ncbi:MAG: hypothetical protein IT167_17320 [Bryobacterales bacterium]|nr:hypothetical protein [Bryobacterales bacterium]
MPRTVLPLLMALALASCSRRDPAAETARLEREFSQMLTGAVLSGKFQTGDRISEDHYTISKASKLSGDTWLIHSRIQYGTHDVTIPIPVTVKWAGDTPVITLTGTTIPGLGTFTARVLFYRGHYAGYWDNKGHGGQMWGVVRRQ